MPRKNERADERILQEQVVEVYRRTAPQERFQIALAWCRDFTQPNSFAAALGVSPIALLVASLIDIEHPLLTSMRRNVSLTSCVVDILKAELERLPVAIPICTHPPVDDLCTVVDNLRFVHRDEA